MQLFSSERLDLVTPALEGVQGDLPSVLAAPVDPRRGMALGLTDQGHVITFLRIMDSIVDIVETLSRV